MIALRVRRDMGRLLLCGGVALNLAACSGSDEVRTVVPDAPVGETTVANTPVVSAPSQTTVTVADSVPVATSVDTVDEPSTTTSPEADEAGPTDPANIYALAGAQAIAARANENDLSGLDDDDVTEALLEAIDAAYEIEYPSIVTYLDVTLDDDANLVVVTEDESQTQVGTAYVCIVGGKAVAVEQSCTTPTN